MPGRRACGWPAELLILAARTFFRSGRAGSLVLFAVALTALYPINGNWWALGAPEPTLDAHEVGTP